MSKGIQSPFPHFQNAGKRFEDQTEREAWSKGWITKGFKALEEVAIWIFTLATAWILYSRCSPLHRVHAVLETASPWLTAASCPKYDIWWILSLWSLKLCFLTFQRCSKPRGSMWTCLSFQSSRGWIKDSVSFSHSLRPILITRLTHQQEQNKFLNLAFKAYFQSNNKSLWDPL